MGVANVTECRAVAGASGGTLLERRAAEVEVEVERPAAAPVAADDLVPVAHLATVALAVCLFDLEKHRERVHDAF